MQAQHIDTCLPCYLLDHHNRDGELLLGVPVDGETSYRSLRDDLIDAINGVSDAPEGFSYDEAREAINGLFEDVSNFDALLDGSLEVPEEEDFDGESAQAWILFTWDV